MPRRRSCAAQVPDAASWSETGIVSYVTSPPGVSALHQQGTNCTLRVAPGTRLNPHPVWGDYLVLWVDRAVNRLSGRVPVFIRGVRGKLIQGE